MTEQELTQARADLEQLGIEQLRCGVMLQLLKIEALTKERDALTLVVDQWRVDFHELSLEYDTLAAAAKMAFDAMDLVEYAVANDAITEDVDVFLQAKSALRQAGVQ